MVASTKCYMYITVMILSAGYPAHVKPFPRIFQGSEMGYKKKNCALGLEDFGFESWLCQVDFR